MTDLRDTLPLDKMLANADRIALPCPVCGAARGKQCISGPVHAARPMGRANDLRAAFGK